MTSQRLEDTSPKVFFALQRFLGPDELAVVRADYMRADDAGGNAEPFLAREEGVSFNPRLARVLSLLVKDLGVRDLLVVRAALYSAVLCGDDAVCEPHPESIDAVRVLLESAERSHELESLVLAVCARETDSRALTIRGVLVLDTLRHLHQSKRSPSERNAVLHYAELLLREAVSASIPQVLREKLQHACMQQRRLLQLDDEAQ